MAVVVVASNDQNMSERDYHKLGHLFHNSAASHPDNTAVVFCHEDTGTKRVTYKELQNQVRRVNAELSMCCRYIALDSLPVNTQYTSQEDQVVEETVTPLRDITDTQVVSINTDTQSEFKKCHSMRDLAYVISTSGSTGSPKIVYVPHSCIIPNITDLVSVFQLNSQDCILAAAPLTFDPSVVDMFMAFQIGAALVVPSRTLLRTPRLLVGIMVEVGVTVVQATPSLLLSLGKERLQQAILSGTLCLKILALGGEIFPKLSVLMDIIGEASHVKIFNLYGITEVSCWSTLHEVTPVCEKVEEFQPFGYYLPNMTPIGAPLTSTQVRLLDKIGNDVGEGEVGEIFVGGNRRQCWVDNGNKYISETAQASLQSTGDKGVLKKGNIYCLGRLSNSLVKRNGQKVSLEEIAGACRSLEYVAVCHVAQHEEGKITAFVLPVTGKNSIDKDVLWNDMRNLLSPGKLPDNIMVVLEIPFNSHGKIDTNHLLKLQLKSVKLNQRNYSRQTLKYFFKDLWIRMIGCKEVTPCDNFIKSGGNSLNAVQFIEELQQFLGFKVTNILDVLLNDSYKKALHLVEEVWYSKRKVEDLDNLNFKNKKLKIKESKDKSCSAVSNTTTFNTHDEILLRLDESNKPLKIIGLSDENQQPKVATIVSRRGERSIRPSQTFDRYLEHTGPTEWRYKLGKCIDSSPLLVKYCDERVLVMVGSHSFRFCCVNGDTGEMHWDITLGDRVESSPAVSLDGRNVYVGCYDGKLYCVCVSDGSVAWEYETEGRGEIKSSPVVDEGTGCVIFGAHDKRLHCLFSDGKLKWAVKVSEGSVFSSPCIVKNMVFVGILDGTLACVDKETGILQWRAHVGSPIFSSPAMYSGGVMLGSVDGQIMSYSLTGQRLWKFKTKSTVFSSPFVLQMKDEREIIAIGSHDHSVYFFSDKGELLTEYAGSSPVYATPFLSYADDPNSFMAVICEASGKICVINVTLPRKSTNSKHSTTKTESLYKEPRTQLHSDKPIWKLEWERKLKGEIFSSPVWHQGKVYVGCRDDYLYCFNLLSQI
ncbi:hypothetical protein Pcinc_027726 [Petrolisthes cinctipes]|uniref:Uncharacterized protein n=1 Tax=Petrolisthes cinctipes TaxID=88211 RepID=A0AAE1K9W7_PETCI|nr:hypothetical protein Pcinc_027726 [Petrolisthes cinctipes]